MSLPPTRHDWVPCLRVHTTHMHHTVALKQPTCYARYSTYHTAASRRAAPASAADVGQSIVRYAKQNDVSMAVLGARGMGSWTR